jgi:hypothetical protein
MRRGKWGETGSVTVQCDFADGAHGIIGGGSLLFLPRGLGCDGGHQHLQTCLPCRLHLELETLRAGADAKIGALAHTRILVRRKSMEERRNSAQVAVGACVDVGERSVVMF